MGAGLVNIFRLETQGKLRKENQKKRGNGEMVVQERDGGI